MRLFLLFLTLLVHVNSYKYLVYSTQFAKSHVNFLARLADVLVDAGHEVVSFFVFFCLSNRFKSASFIGYTLSYHGYSIRRSDDQEIKSCRGNLGYLLTFFISVCFVAHFIRHCLSIYLPLQIPQCEQAAGFQEMFRNDMSKTVWKMQHPIRMFLVSSISMFWKKLIIIQEARHSFTAWGYLGKSWF